MDTVTNTVRPTVTIRPRRAGYSRPTQIQIPIALFMHSFFDGVFEIVNDAGTARKIVRARARGRLNTVKVEVPEIAHMSEPVLRLTRYENGTVAYKAFDAFLPGEGDAIYQDLRTNNYEKGVVVTRPNRRWKATWYRVAA